MAGRCGGSFYCLWFRDWSPRTLDFCLLTLEVRVFLMGKTIKEKIRTTLRITLGVCFIISGVMKAINVYSFAQEIRLYIEAYMDFYFVQWTVEIAVVICSIEIITGLLALRKKYEPIVNVIFLWMMFFFVWLTGINLFYPSLMGSIESCGCFGELVHFSPFASFVKSIVLCVMTFMLSLLCQRTECSTMKDIMTDVKTYLMVFSGILPPLYSYFCFENMKHEWYLAGYIVLCFIIAFSLGSCYVTSK